MVVTHNDIVNAIINAENIAFMYCQARVNTLSNGVLPTAQQNAAIVELEAWINILEVAEAQWEEGCITSDDTWQVIQNINQLSQEVPCNVSRAISRNSSSGGGSSTPTGYVERVFAYLIDATNPSVLNPIVNNTNPSRPIINLFIDGVSITGTGTEDDPLVAAGGGGTVVSVNGQTGVVVLTTTNIAEGTNQYFTTAKVLATALTGLSITGSSVVSTDTILQAFGKLQNQINSLVGGVIYQGTWNASTNSPTITSGVGTKGYYYVVNVAGTTNIDGITDWEVGDWIIYNGTAWQKVDNTDAGAGNANITQIAAAALLALQGAGTLDTTTLYVVTDAPYVIMIAAKTTSQLSQTGQIIDATYSGTVDYDLGTNTFLNGTIYDGDGNTWNGCLPSVITKGTGCVSNIFLANGSNTLGDSCRRNLFKQGTNGWTFGDQLSDVTIESASGATGLDCTNLTNYSFLYGNGYSAEIRYDGINWYHTYYDPANDRIVTTLMVAPFTVSYIGGGGSGGDAYLANDQTFTGENTFAIGSGTKVPIIITKGGSGAGLKVTKSSGSGDAIEVAQGSVSIADETASTIASFDSNKRIKSLATATYPSLIELSYVKGLTSDLQPQINGKQATLVSATNIKTINGSSILGSGDLTVTAAGAPIASVGDGTAVTGTTANTYTKGLLIPANSRTANDAPQIDCNVTKTGAAGNLTIRFYWNTTNDLTGSPILIGTSATVATLGFTISRVLSIEVANGTGNGTKVQAATVALSTSWGAITTTASILAIDWTAAGYLIVAVQNGSAADSSVCNMIKLH